VEFYRPDPPNRGRLPASDRASGRKLSNHEVGANLALSTLPRVRSHPDRELQRAASDHSAGYYDADAEQIGKWLDTVKKSKISNVIGVMYTTWKQDYSHLKEF
jgi:hypothetical protein